MESENTNSFPYNLLLSLITFLLPTIGSGSLLLGFQHCIRLPFSITFVKLITQSIEHTDIKRNINLKLVRKMKHKTKL